MSATAIGATVMVLVDKLQDQETELRELGDQIGIHRSELPALVAKARELLAIFGAAAERQALWDHLKAVATGAVGGADPNRAKS